MYAGFKLELNDSNQIALTESLEKCGIDLKEYLEININETNSVKNTLENYILSDGSLEATKMLDEWFPGISCEVFISHSHKDKEAAELLAKWLYGKFGIRSFIDSSVWGFCDDLLLEIDNKYSLHASSGNYNYKKRNISTAHVHMLLTTALTMMIDKTECLMFLNTPNSVNPVNSISKAIEQTTYSPWIFGELSFSRLLRRRPLEEHRSKPFALEERALVIQYPAPQSHLAEITLNDLLKWSSSAKKNDSYRNLDSLYELKNDLIGGK